MTCANNYPPYGAIQDDAAAEALGRAIIDALPAHIAVLDDRGIIIAANRPWVRFAAENGLPDTRRVREGTDYVAVCRKAADMKDPLAREALAGIEAVLSGQLATFTLDYPCHSPTQQRWFMMDVRHSDDVAVTVVAHFDITERKKAEMALRENEQRLRAIFEQAPLGIAIIDAITGQFRKVNPQYCKITGYPESAMLDLAFQHITHPDDLQEDLDNMQRLRAGELHMFQMEKRYFRKDGSVVWVTLTCVPLWEAPGADLQHIAMVEDITARKLFEARLAESERKYRELVEHANSIILRWTHDGRITFLNEFGQRFFGYSAEEIIGRHVIGTIVPTTDNEGLDLRQLMDRICADPVAFEQNVNENMRRNGERVWIAWTNRIVQDAHGQVAEIFSVGTDITELKRAGEKLRGSEHQLSLILNNVSDVIFAIAVEPDDDFRFTQVNRRFCEVTGLAESQVVGALVRDVIPESAHASVLGRYHEAIRSRLPVHWEEVSDYPTGRKVGYVTVVPVFDAQGACSQLIGMVHDITEVKQAQDAMRASEERLRQIVKCVPDLIWIIDLSGHFIYVNSAVEHLYGWTVEEFLKLTLRDTVTPRQADKDLAMIEEEIARAAEPSYERNIIRTFESEEVRKDGSTFWAELHVAFLWSDDGKPVAIIGTTRDITERKRAEEAIRELNAGLEQRVAQRTAELAVARDRAEAADRFQVRLPGQHVPRTADAAELHHRLHGHPAPGPARAL